MFIRWKTYLLVLCLTGTSFYPVLGLAQRASLHGLTASQALEYAMNYYFSLRSEVLMGQEPRSPLFDPQLPFHRFYEADFSLMAIPIDKSREALLAFEQLRSIDYQSEADFINAARASGKIALYRFDMDEEHRVTTLFEPRLESQNPLQSLSDRALADHIDQQYDGYVFDRHRDFAVIFQAWIRDMSSLNTPNTLTPYQLPNEIYYLIYWIIVGDNPRIVKQDIGLFHSIKKESLERLSHRGYSPEFIRQIDHSLFLPHNFFRQVATVLRIPRVATGLRIPPDRPLRELSGRQLGQQLSLYSAIDLDDLSVRDEPILREVFQRLSLIKLGYFLTMDEFVHFLLVTDDALSRMIMVLDTPDVPIEELSNEDLAKRIDFYPPGPASLFVELNADQHIRQGLERVSAYYSEYIEPYINDAPTLSKVLRLLDQAMASELLPGLDLGSIFNNIDDEQLQRIEPLVSSPAEDGHWPLDFYRQHLPEGHQLSGLALIEQFSEDVHTARVFVEASRRLESEDPKELSDKDLASRIVLSSPNPNMTSYHYPLSGLPVRLIGLDRYIEEGLERVSRYYGGTVREHIDNALTLSKVLDLLDHSKNQRTQLELLSDLELSDRINALSSSLKRKHIKGLRKLLAHLQDTGSWSLGFYVEQFSENRRLSGMDLIEQFDRDIQRATLLYEGVGRLVLDEDVDLSDAYLRHITAMVQNLTRLHFLVNDLVFDQAFAIHLLGGYEGGWLPIGIRMNFTQQNGHIVTHSIEYDGGLQRHPLPEEELIFAEIDAQMLGRKPKNTKAIKSLWLNHQLTRMMDLQEDFASQVNAITEGKEPNVVIKQKLITFVLSYFNDSEFFEQDGYDASLFIEDKLYMAMRLEETEFIKSRFPRPSCPVDRLL